MISSNDIVILKITWVLDLISLLNVSFHADTFENYVDASDKAFETFKITRSG